MVQIGILNGDFNYVKKSALTAIYYYTIEYLRKKNIKNLVLDMQGLLSTTALQSISYTGAQTLFVKHLTHFYYAYYRIRNV